MNVVYDDGQFKLRTIFNGIHLNKSSSNEYNTINYLRNIGTICQNTHRMKNTLKGKPKVR